MTLTREEKFDRRVARDVMAKCLKEERLSVGETRREAVNAAKRELKESMLRHEWDAEIDIRNMDRMPNNDGSETYPPRRGKCNIRCGCDREQTFCATLYDLQKLSVGTCCPRCGWHEAKEEFEKAVEALGGHVTGTYVLGSSEIAVSCAEGHAFSITPHRLKHNGLWCQECLRPRAAATAARLQAVVADAGGILLTPYVKSNEPVQIQCSSGHTWSVTPSAFLANNRWCKECAWIAGTTMAGVPRKAKAKNTGEGVLNRKSQEVVDRIIAAAAERGGEMVGPYVQSMQPITLRCAAGHTWQTTPNIFLQHGRWCRVCAALTNTTLTGRKRKTRGSSKA